MPIDPELWKQADGIEKALMDKGLIIEAGWEGFKLLTIPPTAGERQLEAMRNAFFAGAQHLFGSIMGGLDDEPNETADDLRRMDNIQKELDRFLVEFKARHGLTN